jgi:hypothetical protein
MANTPSNTDTAHDSPAAHPGYEPDRAYATGVLLAGLGLLVIMLVSLALMYWLVVAWSVPVDEPDPVRQLTPVEPWEPPDPDQPRDLQRHLQREQEVLTSSGWVDREQGIARIPIDEAMRHLAEQGLDPDAFRRATGREPVPEQAMDGDQGGEPRLDERSGDVLVEQQRSGHDVNESTNAQEGER